MQKFDLNVYLIRSDEHIVHWKLNKILTLYVIWLGIWNIFTVESCSSGLIHTFWKLKPFHTIIVWLQHNTFLSVIFLWENVYSIWDFHGSMQNRSLLLFIDGKRCRKYLSSSFIYQSAHSFTWIVDCGNFSKNVSEIMAWQFSFIPFVGSYSVIPLHKTFQWI